MEETCEVDQVRAEIVKILTDRLGIKTGSISFPIPQSTIDGGVAAQWAFKVEIRRSSENTGTFTYRGPWHEDYFEAIKLALDEVSQ